MSTIIASEGLVDRLVLFAPYFELPFANEPATVAATLIQGVLPFIPKVSRGKINDPDGYELYEPGTYFLSIRAFVGLQALAATARTSASDLDVETLVFQSPNDTVASFDATIEVLGKNPRVRIVEIPASDHILLYDFDRTAIIDEVVKFVRINPPDDEVVDP